MRFSRPAIGDDPAWSSTRTTTSTSRTSGNLRPGVTYTVVVTAINKAGKRGKSATTTGTVEGTDSSGPSAVRGLGTSPYDSDRFKVTWSAPSNDGGSPISTYEVRYSRPAVGSSPAWSKAWSAQGTSRTFEPAHKGVTYTVVVTAINKAGKRGKSATTTGTVEGTGPSTTKLSKDYPEVNDCWTRPHEWDGYQTGQCTSYVAWRLRENGVGESDLAYGSHYGFYNQWNAAPCAAVDRVGVPRWGNANQWDDCAKQIGMRVDKNPAPGSVLVKNDTGGGFGHVAYVEKVNRDGSIVISDGNFNSRCGIRTSQTVKKGTSPFGGDFWFIHFEEHAKRLAN